MLFQEYYIVWWFVVLGFFLFCFGLTFWGLGFFWGGVVFLFGLGGVWFWEGLLLGVLWFFLIKCENVKILDAGFHCVLTFQASTRSLSMTIFYITHFSCYVLLRCFNKSFLICIYF